MQNTGGKIRPGIIFKWRGKLVEAIATTDDPCIIFKMVKSEDKPKCENCGHILEEEINMVIDSLLFKENAEAVKTL